MAVKVTLAGKLPALDVNGLSPIAPAIHDNQDAPVYVVAELRVNDVTYHQTSGDVTLKLGIDRIEALRGFDEQKAIDLLRYTSEARVGVMELPGFDDEQEAILSMENEGGIPVMNISVLDVDDETGEIQ